MPQAGPEPSDDGLVDAGLCPRTMNRYPSTKRKSMAAIILRRVMAYESSKVGRASPRSVNFGERALEL